MNDDLPVIDKILEVGENLFCLLSVKEKILQGWDPKTRRTVYLFKTDTGDWGFYDKETNQVIEVDKWKKKAAWINGRWVKMSVYYKLNVVFEEAVTFSSWNKMERKVDKMTAVEAVIVLTSSAYDHLINQMEGRPKDSFYKLSFATRKKAGGGNMKFVDNVIWVK